MFQNVYEAQKIAQEIIEDEDKEPEEVLEDVQAILNELNKLEHSLIFMQRQYEKSVQ